MNTNKSTAVAKYKNFTAKKTFQIKCVVSLSVLNDNGLLAALMQSFEVNWYKMSIYTSTQYNWKSLQRHEVFHIFRKRKSNTQNQNNACYYQLQGLIAIVETQETDLVIYTNKSFQIENVKRDRNKWKREIHPDLTFLFSI